MNLTLGRSSVADYQQHSKHIMPTGREVVDLMERRWADGAPTYTQQIDDLSSDNDS